MQDWWQATFPQGRQTLTISDAHGYPVKIAYGEKGTGKPLILLHGIGSWSYNWRSSIDPLSKSYSVICFDAKGYGFSDKPLYRDKPAHQVVELERIIRALCDEPAVIVAESLGALVALAVAQDYPELVARLIVVNVPIFAQKLPHWGMWLLSKTPLELVQVIDNFRFSYFFSPLVRELMLMERRTVLFDPTMLTKEDAYWISYPYIELPGTLTKVTEELQIAAQEIENLQANKPNFLSKIQSKLAEIKCQTLILWGEQDSWFPVSDGKKLQHQIPNSQLQILPNCCHDASYGASVAVNAAVLRFLQETEFC